MTTLWLALAGGAGAVARLVVDGEIRRRWSGQLPWATIVINITGSLILGVLAGLVIYHGVTSDLKLVAGTGFCGGYTTFSTASFETVRLAQQRSYRLALVNGIGTALLAVAAGAMGLLIVH